MATCQTKRSDHATAFRMIGLVEAGRNAEWPWMAPSGVVAVAE